jgi:hypothetical protein
MDEEEEEKGEEVCDTVSWATPYAEKGRALLMAAQNSYRDGT